MRCSLSSGVKLILRCEQVLRLMFPEWRRKGILSFMHHYNRYKYMHLSFQVCDAPSIYTAFRSTASGRNLHAHAHAK